MNAPIVLREETEANQVESRVSPVNRPTGKLFQPSGQLRLVPALGKARPSLCKTLPSQLRDPVASQLVRDPGNAGWQPVVESPWQ